MIICYDAAFSLVINASKDLPTADVGAPQKSYYSYRELVLKQAAENAAELSRN